jgi:serine/threonine protein phosphatase 1
MPGSRLQERIAPHKACDRLRRLFHVQRLRDKIRERPPEPLSESTFMSTVAIGDLHGYLEPLQEMLEQIGPVLTEADTVVFLGDYIDRGPQSKQCIEALLAFRKQTAATVVCLLGNHEEWLLETLRDYRRHSWLLAMEVWPTIDSYSAAAGAVLRAARDAAGRDLFSPGLALPYDAFFDIVPRRHLSFFKKLSLFHRTTDCVCTHGGLDPRVPPDQPQRRHALVWGASSFPDAYTGSEIVVYGHWNNADVDDTGWPQPRIVGHTIGIDTIGHGVLTAIRLPDRRVFQTRKYPEAVRFKIQEEEG